MVDVIEDRRASNALLPISKLNDDILSQIFMLNAHLDFNRTHLPSTTIRYTSQVYQRWRDILLNYPLVWAASLDFGDPRAWIDIVIKRTGDAPVNIVLPSVSRCLVKLEGKTRIPLPCLTISELQHSYLRIHDPLRSTTDDEVDLALSLLPRWNKVAIKVDSFTQSQDIVRRLSGVAAPYLQELTLAMNEHHQLCILEGSNIPVNNGPQIQCLNIRGCGTNFLSPIYRNLTVLYATLVPVGKGLTPDRWLSVLRRLPQLEYLKLSFCFEQQIIPSGDVSPESSPDQVSLPCLRWFELKGDCWSCHRIFPAISFPASCSLYITYDGLSATSHPVSTMMSELGKKVHLHFPDLTALSLDMVGGKNFTATNNYHVRHGDKILSISFSSIFDHIGIILPELVNLLRFISGDVNDLYFNWWTVDGQYPSRLWTLFEPFEQLTVLRIKSRQVLAIMASIYVGEDRLSENRVILPRLSKLLLSGIDFMVKGHIKPVLDFLRLRSQTQAPIDYILMRGCLGRLLGPLETQLRVTGIEIEVDQGPEGPDFYILPLFTPQW